MLARIKALFGNLAIYGLGDVATSIVSLLLLPIYTRYLTPSDYGVIAMLLTIEAVAKVVFRWGVDTAFMRLYYDCADAAARQRLASTIFFFLLAVNGSLVMAAVSGAGWLSVQLFSTPQHALLIALVIVNTFVAGFYFIPFQVLRIGEHSKQFIALVFARSAGTLVVRLVLVIGFGMGVFGVVVADVVVTAIFTPVLARWFVPLLRPVFSRTVITEALKFGLPRIPHSIANQVIGLADRYFLNAFGTLRDVGLYSIGASFGLAPKLFLSAFESAWTPFFLGLMKEADAPRIYSVVSTYVVALLVLIVGGLCAVASDVLRLTTTREFHAAAVVTPWIALGVMCQGFYLLSSIGLVITKRTTLYPLATGSAAAVSLLANALLIPRYGVIGAAWSNTIAYASLALVTGVVSWRLYPVRYEWTRLARVAGAGLVAVLLAREGIPAMPALAGLLVRGTTMVVAYLALLYLAGFFQPAELRVMSEARMRALARRPRRGTPPPQSDQVEMAGEIVATSSEPPIDALDDGAANGAERQSRFPISERLTDQLSSRGVVIRQSRRRTFARRRRPGKTSSAASASPSAQALVGERAFAVGQGTRDQPDQLERVIDVAVEQADGERVQQLGAPLVGRQRGEGCLPGRRRLQVQGVGPGKSARGARRRGGPPPASSRRAAGRRAGTPGRGGTDRRRRRAAAPCRLARTPPRPRRRTSLRPACRSPRGAPAARCPACRPSGSPRRSRCLGAEDVVEPVGRDVARIHDVEAPGIREGVEKRPVRLVDGAQSGVLRDVEAHRARPIGQGDVEEHARRVGGAGGVGQPGVLGRIGLEAEEAKIGRSGRPVLLQPPSGPDIDQHERVSLVDGVEFGGDEDVHAFVRSQGPVGRPIMMDYRGPLVNSRRPCRVRLPARS